MSFHEVRFPTNLSFGAIGGPERRTDVVTLANGFEERNTPWQHSRRRYDAGAAMRSLDDIELLIAFFEARQGQLHGFRWKDWTDHKSCTPSQAPAFDDQMIAIGDGVTQSFQLTKTYASGDQSYQRPICKPVGGTVRIAVAGIELSNGADFTVDTTTGVVSLTTAPAMSAAITAGFEFDVPVRFGSDSFQTSAASFGAGDVPDVPVVEVRI
ncbi:TIGR02217 family protein [Pseudooceanicola sediminis]|uniref:TIGR02217 family protein n=1 Tax=Pseudooceanicola sediminis TaxID=2211117 RepID=A0A399J5A5_9RHOB|nr:DUF2460 domain-containing protein [Pseudooceanicola sediminis]KAA2317406.1 TIGR02217 family protein [Puniceibacterium sp. HSS470]RII39757.1 TIGR02217 family protein [Pseudooceanicola sediminis]|tara:strand:- start:8358 stop:8990 length:633 start_codon:yes stop_codon:yes gene_type:complete